MHCLIVGMTESGKTTLAKRIAKTLKSSGKLVAVLDPLQDEGWECDFQTQNPEEFLVWAKGNRSAFLFVDESGVAIGRYNVPMEWLATQSRHLGHSCYFICQGLTQLSTIVRGQCRKLYMFASGSNATKTASEEWNESELQNAERLQKGEFYVVSRFDKISKGRVDFTSDNVYSINQDATTDPTTDRPELLVQPH